MKQIFITDTFSWVLLQGYVRYFNVSISVVLAVGGVYIHTHRDI